ncbi:hypothetical protein Q5P01_025705 [Channa striata]|uniref:Glycosyl hydrolases family 22 (GH22) domain-containing protein n=1 Tax=Channa striata TaxID=64152 RepID=A0AA88LIE6_CHASR|nr:hypothetical protein Q5P01_025705 [Channa striata]
MKVLAVFLLAVLGCSLTEGRVYTRCELRNQLQQVFNSLPPKTLPNGVNVDDLVTKNSQSRKPENPEKHSGHDHPSPHGGRHKRHLENQPPADSQSHKPENPEQHSGHDHPSPHGGRHKRHLENQPPADSQSHKPENPEQHSGHDHSSPHGGRHKRHVENQNAQGQAPADSESRKPENPEKHSGHNHPTPHGGRHRRDVESQYSQGQASEYPEQNKDSTKCTLFGIFQFSNHIACTNNDIKSQNICKTNCTNFLDDDLSQDIDCLVKLISTLR